MAHPFFISFLAAHGLVHIAVWSMPKPADGKEPPFDAAHSWLLGDARTLAISLAIAAAVLFVIAALGLFGHAEWWRTMALRSPSADAGIRGR